MPESVAPSPTTLIPQPASWHGARSLTGIDGMTDDEKTGFQTCLRDLMDTHLDRTKLWTEHTQGVRDKVIEEACAKCPYVRERYEGAWPIEAWLRSRLTSSKSKSKSKRSSRKARPQPRSKAKAELAPEESVEEGTSTKSQTKAEPASEELKDKDTSMESQAALGMTEDMDAEVDELLGDEAELTDTVPNDPGPSEGSSQDMNQTLVELFNMELPSVTMPHGPSGATHIAHSSQQGPAPQLPLPSPTQAAKHTPARRPHTPTPTPSRAPTPTPHSRAGFKKPRLADSPQQTIQQALENLPEQSASQGSEDTAIRQFLEGLAEPSGGLLPRFIAHGVSTASSLRALGLVAPDCRDQFLRTDLALNSFEICLVCDGLRRLVQQPGSGGDSQTRS